MVLRVDVVDVPPMLLLPLAENAMKHGPGAGHRGRVELSVRADATTLHSPTLPTTPFLAELAFPYAWQDVQKAGLAAGLVDNKVAAFSSRLTAIRFVIPVARRTAPR